jgi:hypothetical protein
LIPAILSVENWVPLKPVLWTWGTLNLFIIPLLQTQSNRTWNIFEILMIFNASEGSLVFSRYFHEVLLYICRSAWNISFVCQTF